MCTGPATGLELTRFHNRFTSRSLPSRRHTKPGKVVTHKDAVLPVVQLLYVRDRDVQVERYLARRHGEFAVDVLDDECSLDGIMWRIEMARAMAGYKAVQPNSGNKHALSFCYHDPWLFSRREGAQVTLLNLTLLG